MVSIVVISGKQGSGKSTLQDALMELAPQNGFVTVTLMNFADVIYNLHVNIIERINALGIEHKTKKDGVLLQLLGTEWGRKVLGNDVWIRALRNRVEIAKNHSMRFNQKTLIVVADCRFENEFDGFKEALRVRLEADEATRKARTNSWRDNTQHPSEVDLDKYAQNGAFDLYFRTDATGFLPETIAHNILTKLNRDTWILERAQLELK